MKFQQGRGEAMRPALAVGLAFLLYATSVGGGAIPGSIPEALVYGAAYALAVFAAIAIEGRRALLLLWILMTVLWTAFLFDSFAAANWSFAEAIKLIVAPFILWSLLGVPLALGTAVFERSPRPHGIAFGIAIVVAGVWLSLVALFGYFARFPPDVGAYPRYGPATLVMSGVTSALWPLLISVACIHRLRSRTAKQT
ncbi:MAG TPA: hypothetical protein VF142_17570 [Longimicrobium sp.]